VSTASEEQEFLIGRGKQIVTVGSESHADQTSSTKLEQHHKAAILRDCAIGLSGPVIV